MMVQLPSPPPISRDLIEYLEKVFSPASLPDHIQSDTQPHAIAAMAHHARGVNAVVKHLKAVHKEQQNEDPLNVSEDAQYA